MEKTEATQETAVQTETKAVPVGGSKLKIKNTLADVETQLLKEQNNFEKFKVPFNVGDTVKVWVKIVEGNKERLQGYEGVVISIQNGGPRKAFTVRRISYDVAIERVFPFHSPFIDKVDVIRRGKVRRAKLYYLRGRFGRAAKITEKITTVKKEEKK